MIWKVFANAVAALHMAWVLWVILGPIWAWRRPAVRAIHLVSLWWAYLVTVSGLYCPTTYVENALRLQYNPRDTYSASFILHYFRPVLFWDLTQRHIVVAMTLWAVLWTIIYAWLWARPKRSSKPA